MKCFDCNSTIPQARIQVVPETEYCVDGVDKHTEPTMGRMIYNHKTAGEVILARGKENIRRLNREYARSR